MLFRRRSRCVSSLRLVVFYAHPGAVEKGVRNVREQGIEKKRNRKREPVLETNPEALSLSLSTALLLLLHLRPSLSFSLLNSLLPHTQQNIKRRRLHLGPPVRQGDAGLAGRTLAQRAPAGLLQEGVPVSFF